MPDSFESAYPLSPSVNPEQIRARANSSSKKKPVVTFFAGDEALEIPDKSEVGMYKPLTRSDIDKSELELDSFAESLTTMHNTWFDKRVLDHRYLVHLFFLLGFEIIAYAAPRGDPRVGNMFSGSTYLY